MKTDSSRASGQAQFARGREAAGLRSDTYSLEPGVADHQAAAPRRAYGRKHTRSGHAGKCSRLRASTVLAGFRWDMGVWIGRA